MTDKKRGIIPLTDKERDIISLIKYKERGHIGERRSGHRAVAYGGQGKRYHTFPDVCRASVGYTYCGELLGGWSVFGIDIIFRIAGIGIVIAVVNQILKKVDREEITTLTTLAGIVIVLFIVLDMVAQLFGTLRNIFGL